MSMDIQSRTPNYATDYVGIYHADCFDGVAAAWVLANRFPGIRLIASDYRDPLPEGLEGKTVYIVDFSYEMEVIFQLTRTAAQVFLIDHHPRAVEIRDAVDAFKDCDRELLAHSGLDLSKLALVVDSKRSGAQLAWDYLYPRVIDDDSYALSEITKLNRRSSMDVVSTPENGKWHGAPRPYWLDAVGYRDLWQFNRMGKVKAICYGLGTLPLDPLVWKATMETFQGKALMDYLHQVGGSIETKVERDLDRVIEQTERTIELDGYIVPLINAPKSMLSDALDRFVVDHPFAVGYYDDATHRVFSLRGKDKINLNELAQQFGGGGHFNAAGFTIPRGQFLAQY